MEQHRGTSVIATAVSEWPSALEDVLLGTSDPARIVGLLEGFSRSALGVELGDVIFYRRGVGAVFGLLLVDDRRVVVKVHRRDFVSEGLDGVRTVQRALADKGLPAPMPVGDPQAIGNGIGAAEEMLSRGEHVDAHDASVRRVLATHLHRFVEAATPMLGEVPLRLASPWGFPDDHQLWPTPHDLRFDFSLPGAEWIDKLAKDARSILRNETGTMVIGHGDWRIENLGMDRSVIVAIFDWDSVCVIPEAALVGATSISFTTDWSDPAIDPFPSLDESSAFIIEYEQARGRAFTSRERELIHAEQIYCLAYGARCDHSDSVLGVFPDDDGESRFVQSLRSMTT